MKTQSLIIGSGPNIRKIESQPDAQPSFSIGDQEIEMIRNTTYFDVQIDNQFNWDKHTDTIKAKANRALGLIKYSKKYLPSHVLSKMYRGIVEPHLSYCCSVWGCCNESKINIAFSYCGAKLWNSLERKIKLAPSLKIFKEKL